LPINGQHSTISRRFQHPLLAHRKGKKGPQLAYATHTAVVLPLRHSSPHDDVALRRTPPSGDVIAVAIHRCVSLSAPQDGTLAWAATPAVAVSSA
jgi:hypothetical protein